MRVSVLYASLVYTVAHPIFENGILQVESSSTCRLRLQSINVEVKIDCININVHVEVASHDLESSGCIINVHVQIKLASSCTRKLRLHDEHAGQGALSFTRRFGTRSSSGDVCTRSAAEDVYSRACNTRAGIRTQDMRYISVTRHTFIARDVAVYGAI